MSSPVTHRKDDLQSDLEVLKARGVLVETRTKIVNHIRGILKSFGVKVARCSTPAFGTHAIDAIPEELRPALTPLIAILGDVNTKIGEYDKKIDDLCQGDYKAEVDIVRQIDGVGPITGLTYILTLGDRSRFRKSRDVGPFLGLRPRRCESGDYAPELRTTRAGDARLRSLLVQSAHYILGPFGKDCELRQWGLKKSEGSKKAKRRAIVAVARKLAVLLHRLLTTGEV